MGSARVEGVEPVKVSVRSSEPLPPVKVSARVATMPSLLSVNSRRIWIDRTMSSVPIRFPATVCDASSMSWVFDTQVRGLSPGNGIAHEAVQVAPLSMSSDAPD